MAGRSRFGYRDKALPVVGRMFRYMNSIPVQTGELSYPGGIDTYKDNDDVKPIELVGASDVRMVRIGRYRTRQGSDRYTVPVGEAVNVQVTATTGAATANVSSINAVAQRITATAGGRATRVDIKIATQAGTSGTVIVELHADGSSAPGTLLARSSISAASITNTAALVPCYFMSAPLLVSGTAYWIVVTGQKSNVGNYLVSTTTASTGLSTSTNSGVSWSTTSSAMDYALYTSTDGGIKGIFRAYRVNGQKVTVFAQGSSVYTVNDTTGAVTVLQSGLNASASDYRFELAQDTLYWCNGFDKPYKWDFTTVTQVTAAPYIPSLIVGHKGMIFYVDANDKTRLFYTNFGLYDTFTSTDFIYVPAPKSYDALTALAPLNGVLYIFANRNKYHLLGSDDATFSLDQASGQKGTYSQESVAYDLNYVYFASDDGIYQFNGTSENNIALSVQDWYNSLTAKANISLELYNNRLYVYYTPPGAATNTNCKVFNTQLGIWESDDTNTQIATTFSRRAKDAIFIQGSSVVGALYWGEQATNDYNNLGDVLQAEIRTNYTHFGAPGQSKRIPKWRPKFMSQSGSYNGQAGYAFDLSDSATYVDVPMGANAPRTDMGLLTDTGVTVGGVALVEPNSLTIPGTFKRVQRRYGHTAAREPVEFDSEVLAVEVQRLV